MDTVTEQPDEKQLEHIAEKVGKLDLADHILAWDRKQHPDNPDARRCQANKAHKGTLQMHGNGAALVCCESRPAPCSYSEPVSR
jgi:hypothetical protein